MENVKILEHPLLQHKISRLRDETTGTNEFSGGNSDAYGLRSTQ